MSRYNLTGRTVVITGSTGGLGSALADALRARGANLALLDLNLEAVKAQAEQLGGGTVARGFWADVRDLGSLEIAMMGAAEHFGRLDIVIANPHAKSVGFQQAQGGAHGNNFGIDDGAVVVK